METLQTLPVEFIKLSLADGYDFSEMSLATSDVIILTEKKVLNTRKRDQLIDQLSNWHQHATFDDQDKRTAIILGNNQLRKNSTHLETYRNYLLEHLEEPIKVTGSEYFSWEERFLFGAGSQKEYKQMKKTHPSYKDTFKLIDIEEMEDGDDRLIAKVMRISKTILKRNTGTKLFYIPLSNLKSVDEDSPNKELLEDFSSWEVNW